ncbi:unnamed protein product [Rotaria socialis]|uniref:Uncharacterized protein n=1 Tax=Rotaria socialis TaxID=392032 RepID=A0A821AZL8_9BILA|nr:unnamed protein product [Rotaria socialis]
MYNKPHPNTTIDATQLKDDIIRRCYSNKLAGNTEKIQPTDNLSEHARKIEGAIKEAASTAIPAKRIAKKPWISEETLNIAEEKRKLKQAKDASNVKMQEYKDLCKKVNKAARKDKENWIQKHCEEVEKGLEIGQYGDGVTLPRRLQL